MYIETLKKIVNIIPNRMCNCTTNLNGKTVLITGGNSGIGFETAKILAFRGARIIIADKNDSTKSKHKIMDITKNCNIYTKQLDLSKLDSVRLFATNFIRTENRLDILINNAGVGGLLHRYTYDLLQEEMQINHFGPFLLTHLLLNLLKQSAPSRIIFVSSTLAYANNLRVENLNRISEYPIMDFLIYSNSKLCNIITANGFAERLKNTGVTSNSLHPGITVTNLYSGMRGKFSLLQLKYIIYQILNVVAKTPLQGAQTVVHLALSKKLVTATGQFFIECRPFDPPQKVKNQKFCEHIWRASEEFVKLRPSEKIQCNTLAKAKNYNKIDLK